jgi:predicted dehydrogenase
VSEHRISRRHFFYGTLLAGAIPAGGFGRAPSLRLLGYKSPNEKLNIAAVGAGGKGASDIAGCEAENIVALCDVDSKRAERTFKKYEKLPKYTDFRRMFDKEGKGIDAVTVAIPDFMHATVAMWAMERGKHVYVQKPLTRTIWEARMLQQAAVKYRVATQMGNQGYSNEGTRQCSEMIWNGDIGNVTEVHAWTTRPIWPQGVSTVPAEEPVPESLAWDTWLGIATARPYSSAYLPGKWRGWFDFGCGALGDMACHVLGAPNMALMLGAPTSVECTEQEGKNALTFPTKSVIRFDFPARGSMPPVKLFWHDGVKEPPYRPEGLPATEKLGDLPRLPNPNAPTGARPAGDARGNPDVGSGVLFIGDKGFITAGEYGASARLVPAERMKDYKFPAPLLTRSPGHYRDWIRACKSGDKSCSDFSVSGPFTEWILTGVLALRFEGKLEWDSAKMKVTNVPEANQYIKPKFRDGWKLT